MDIRVVVEINNDAQHVINLLGPTPSLCKDAPKVLRFHYTYIFHDFVLIINVFFCDFESKIYTYFSTF